MNNLQDATKMNKKIKQTITVPVEKEELTKILLSTVQNVIEFSSVEHLTKLADLVQPKKSSVSDVALAREITGDYYTDSPEPIAAIANYKTLMDRRQDLLNDCWGVEEVRKFLGFSHRSSVGYRREKLSLLGLKDGGSYYYPQWQFDPEGEDRVITGLPDVLKALEIDDFVKAYWLISPHLAMDGKTPLQMLKTGDKETVVIEARAVQ
jgi:hypothetical protein